MLTKVINNLSRVLEKRRYMALVIGDKYSKGNGAGWNWGVNGKGGNECQ